MAYPTLTDSESNFSIIIPTLNGERFLEELLASITIQSKKPFEVIVVDSDSQDESVRCAEKFGAHTIAINRDDFDHGGTRTMAALKAQKDILVYFTQDVLPAHRSVLEQLLLPLEQHDVAASYGRQLPRFNASETARHLRLFNYPGQSRYRSFSDRENLGLATIFFSNSCGAYRKKNLAEVGFFRDDLIFGEDTCAVARLLEKGYRISYAAEAAVYHSHNYTWEEEFKRYFDIGVLHTIEKWLQETYGTAENRGMTYLKSGVTYLAQRRKYSLIPDFMVRVMMKYAGYALGKHYFRLPTFIVPKLSSHRSWWNRH